jgi:hypothetical protein
MSYTQLRNFNQSTAGKVAGLCLQNVREGYGIAAKYPDAWAAWEGTDQHSATPPSGVAVPCFFSYDGPTNGHVGVSLADGQFWSDGVVYASIAAFNETHTPVYVGWSTSIEGEAVVEEVATPAPAPAPAPSPTPAPAPTPAPVADKEITLPPTMGPTHLYHPGGPYNPNNPADYIAIVHPALYAPGGITYTIVAYLGNGVYRINSPAHGIADIWTNGSPVSVH